MSLSFVHSVQRRAGGVMDECVSQCSCGRTYRFKPDPTIPKRRCNYCGKIFHWEGGPPAPVLPQRTAAPAAPLEEKIHKAKCTCGRVYRFKVGPKTSRFRCKECGATIFEAKRKPLKQGAVALSSRRTYSPLIMYSNLALCIAVFFGFFFATVKWGILPSLAEDFKEKRNERMIVSPSEMEELNDLKDAIAVWAVLGFLSLVLGLGLLILFLILRLIGRSQLRMSHEPDLTG